MIIWVFIDNKFSLSFSEGKYEFLWLNQHSNKIFAALYYDSSESDFPKFYYSDKTDGADYTEQGKLIAVSDCE